MNRNNRLNILLVEILIATLFFALTSTVILRVYSVTRKQSVNAGIENTLQNEIQNYLALCCNGEDPNDVLVNSGFIRDDEGYLLENEEYLIRIQLSEEKTEAGILREACAIGFIDNEQVISVPGARYIPEVKNHEA